MSSGRKRRETDPNEKPYMVFQYCKTKCCLASCHECGRFWGPGCEKWSGQPATWSGPGNAGGVGRP